MRIWSKELIEVLPKKQLMAMRYELGDMIKQYPNIKNRLVKFANNYDIGYLGYYFCYVCDELDNRGVNTSIGYEADILDIVRDKTIDYKKDSYAWSDLQFNEDNEEYLKICLMNLYEKHIRNIISQEEWQKIEDKFGGLM